MRRARLSFGARLGSTGHLLPVAVDRTQLTLCRPAFERRRSSVQRQGIIRGINWGGLALFMRVAASAHFTLAEFAFLASWLVGLFWFAFSFLLLLFSGRRKPGPWPDQCGVQTAACCCIVFYIKALFELNARAKLEKLSQSPWFQHEVHIGLRSCVLFCSSLPTS